MPQMMPIWWSIILFLSLAFFLSINTILFFFPLYNLVGSINKMENMIKFIDISKYDL